MKMMTVSLSPPTTRVNREKSLRGSCFGAKGIGRQLPRYRVSAMNNSGSRSGKRSTRSITENLRPKMSLT